MRYTVSGSLRIVAPPQRIYRLISDYHTGHPTILPKQFSNMRVEAGGIGAGTRVAFDMTVLGQKQHFVALVSEPEPGRVLVETNLEPHDSVSTFIIDPEDDGRAATVTIQTDMPGRAGVAGAIEKFVARRVLKSIYAEELRLLQLRAAEDGKHVGC
jgi:Polyketide cyclase / dehydrase and lipid transport